MKKIAVFTVLAMVLIASASSAAQTPVNDAQRVVGTWVCADGDGLTWVFNANGTGTLSGGGELVNIFWGVSSPGMISISVKEGRRTSLFSSSPDGRRMTEVLAFSPDGRIMLIGGLFALQRR